jgi:DNA processing protein
MQGTHSTQTQLDYLLALKMIKGVGNVTAFKLLDYFSSAQAIFNASVDELVGLKLKRAIIKQIKAFNFDQIEPLKDWAQSPDRHIISFDSPHYPELLSQIYNPPLLLFALGNINHIQNPQIAIVGSRNPTRQGIENTHMFCEALVEHGLTITSGLAMGIDGEAHKATLKARGITIGVTGTGLNRVYPAKHRELAHQIAEKGLLISEKFPDEPFDQGSFPQRNRIIAGLSLGTLVVEATEKSGSLITANQAVEEGREVYAIPGSIHNPLAKGCHKLIKQGAKLVESIHDVIDDLPRSQKCYGQASLELDSTLEIAPISDENKLFLECLDYEAIPINTIVERSRLTVEQVTNKLLELELDGWVINSASGYSRK